ncbi:MAG: LysM peptidoglycan-binding domain-containing protein [Chloroflexi bacterium]|nr:LysM peptidoglycan-binding domain-containing protein [Chloroflexota bacterium]
MTRSRILAVLTWGFLFLLIYMRVRARRVTVAEAAAGTATAPRAEALAFPMPTSLPGRPTPTPLPTRAPLPQGTLVDYTAQPGDSLPALARRFHTTVPALLRANPAIPPDITTLPPGYPMRVPYYYFPTWGSPFKILPDALFVNGPASRDFDTAAFAAQFPGWLNAYQGYAMDTQYTGPSAVDMVALNYSISPRLLLALLEYQAAALSDPNPPGAHMLGFPGYQHRGLFLQLSRAAMLLNHGYYAWRLGRLDTLILRDGTEVRLDPWLNAATAALHYYFAQTLSAQGYHQAVSPQGFFRLYAALFGDPWQNPPPPHLPGNLQQPELVFPMPVGRAWSYTGGPHPAWGDELLPWAAVDFAPAGIRGCEISREWAVALADGVVTRSGRGIVVLDLDGDGDERTGWVIFYLHLVDTPPVGTTLHRRDPIGRPSCEGGHATGSHVHLARKYNGEWMDAEGPVPWVMEDWLVVKGQRPYDGWLKLGDWLVRASPKGTNDTLIAAGRK